MNGFSVITPEIKALAAKCSASDYIDPALYTKFNVKRGLRDLSGKGVLTGLTEISSIKSCETLPDGTDVPAPGVLRYRGIDIKDLVKGFVSDGRFGFEETVYLLLFGSLPNENELEDFKKILFSYRSLPTSFVRDIIMKAPSSDMMNTLARSVLTLYSYDDNPNDTSVENVLRQCLQLIALRCSRCTDIRPTAIITTVKVFLYILPTLKYPPPRTFYAF